MAAPVAPWTLAGESLVALARCHRQLAEPLPWGLRRLPGPLLVAAVAYHQSPVGQYLELAIGEPARLGARPGWCMTTMVVDSPASRQGGRVNWGLPKELGTLVWESDGRECEMRWVERGLVVRGRPGRWRVPGLVPLRAVQRRSDGPVVVPGRLRGEGRLCRVEVEVPEDDALAPLAGWHAGCHVASMRFILRPARTPVGFASSLLAPLRAPEPALSLGLPGRLAQR